MNETILQIALIALNEIETYYAAHADCRTSAPAESCTCTSDKQSPLQVTQAALSQIEMIAE